jgi:GGDEF domain-containing protein
MESRFNMAALCVLLRRACGQGPVAQPWAWMLAGLLLVSLPLAAQPVKLLVAPQHSLALPSQVAAFELGSTEALEPEAIWQRVYSPSQAANAPGLWTVNDWRRTAAKFSLSSTSELVSILDFPLVRMDRVDLFWRVPGKTWNHAVAGDTVPLSQWPLIGQHPSFVLHFDSMPGTLDVLAVMQNAGFGETTALLSADRDSRERRMLQASMAGLLIGASAMMLLVVILLCTVYRTRGSVYLLGYSISVTLAAIVLTGYGAIWFTPEWPQFNDSIKPFASTIASITMLLAALAALDRGAVGAKWRYSVYAVSVLLSVYALLQVFVLPHVWRLAGGVATGTVVTVMGLGASIYGWRRGDRYAPWVMLAVVFFALCAIVVSRGFVLIGGVDAFSMAMICFLIASCMTLRHVLILRERFGRAVIGRAATHRYRDPLTALLSAEGLEREVEQLAVRQQTSGGVAHVLYFSLQALEHFRHEDGYVVWQRDLVRFAAVLQKALGEEWHIARLSNSKFGAVRLQGRQKIMPEPLLTLVLAHCSRKIDTHDWVDRVGLRMAATSTVLTRTAMEDVWRSLEQDVLNLPPGKRIASI